MHTAFRNGSYQVLLQSLTGWGHSKLLIKDDDDENDNEDRKLYIQHIHILHAQIINHAHT